MLAGAGHNDTFDVGGEEYLDELQAFCRRWAGGGQAEADRPADA